MTVTQSDKGLAKIAEGASSRRHAETSPVKVKDTHLMNNKLPPAEILCGDCAFSSHSSLGTSRIQWENTGQWPKSLSIIFFQDFWQSWFQAMTIPTALNIDMGDFIAP